MRITVLVSQAQRKEIPRLRDFLEKRYISSVFYIIDSHWSLNGEEQLLRILREAFDLLIYCRQKDLDALWIPYISGYSQERNQHNIRRIHKIFFITHRTSPLPLWLRHKALISDYGKLNTYFETVKLQWHRINDIFIAKKYIKEMGYSHLNTPVFVGNKKMDLLLLELYIEGGGNPNYINEEGVPLLNQIIRNDDKTLAYHLIKRGCDINLIASDRGTNALMEASSRGYEDLISYLISMGAELEHESKEGQTAVILAMGNQHKDAALVLMEAGADCLKLDQLEMNALKYAQLYGFKELEQRIINNNEK